MIRAEHEITPAVAGRLAAATSPTGLLLGREPDGRPALLRMFRPEPTRITVVGDPRLTWILVFRSLALGARALVTTTDPGRWNGLGEAATGSADRIRIVGGPEPVQAYIAEPVLRVFDIGGRCLAEPGPNDSWQTTMTVARQVHEPATETLFGSDAVLVQRMWPAHVEHLAATIGIDPQVAAPIAAMPDDMVAVVRRGGVRFVRLSVTAIEQHMFGTQQR